MSLTSLCSNCPDTTDGLLYGVFTDSNFSILKDGLSLLTVSLKDIAIPLIGYSFEEFSIEPSDPLPAQPTVVPLIYGNMVGAAQEVKLLMIIPIYDKTVKNIEYEQNIQWRFDGSTVWSNIGPIMVLVGSENDPNYVGNSNKIGPIEFRNLTTETVRLKIIIGI